MRILILIALAVVVTGCATAAQQQATKMVGVFQQAGKEVNACVATIYNKPEYAAVASHLPLPSEINKPTMSQLADDSLPTEEESKLLINMHDDAIPCRA